MADDFFSTEILTKLFRGLPVEPPVAGAAPSTPPLPSGEELKPLPEKTGESPAEWAHTNNAYFLGDLITAKTQGNGNVPVFNGADPLHNLIRSRTSNDPQYINNELDQISGPLFDAVRRGDGRLIQAIAHYYPSLADGSFTFKHADGSEHTLQQEIEAHYGEAPLPATADTPKKDAPEPTKAELLQGLTAAASLNASPMAFRKGADNLVPPAPSSPGRVPGTQDEMGVITHGINYPAVGVNGLKR